MAISNFEQEIEKECERILTKEQTLGKTLMQPYTYNNSGSRKILYCIQLEHALPLLRPEIPYLQTGYENKFGDYSSSVVRSDDEYEVVGKISKFENKPNHYYILLMRNTITNELGMVERIMYKHNTETYGYLYNNSILDSLEIGHEVHKNELFKCSESFDEYGNRCDGVNLLTTYVATDKSMEDGFIISKSAQKKLGSPLIKKVQVNINGNDVPLNIHGNSDNYKSFPDIGETIENGVLCCLRRDNADESFYTQTWENLQKIMTSDDKYTVKGKVIDIDIFTNIPEEIKEKATHTQLYHYYHEKRKFLLELVTTVESAMKKYNCSGMSYDLSKLYNKAIKELDEKKYIRDNKVYNGTIVEFTVLEYNYPDVGDKLSNRCGGKGVISEIKDDEDMIKLDNGQHVEIYLNQATTVNRLNAMQLKEITLSMMSQRIVEYIGTDILDVDESFELILEFLKIVSPTEYWQLKNTLESMYGYNDKDFFLASIVDDGKIYLSTRPMSDMLSLDDIAKIYEKFPWIKQYTGYSPIVDSNGNVRYIQSIRPFTAGYMYFYRLKQYAEEKFSVTNLASTNLKNENTKSKASKNYRATHKNTPIQFGNMESGDLGHLGMDVFVKNLLIYSLSPKQRERMEALWTEDPYEINIELGDDCKNRSVEILNARLKTIGLRLEFIKIPKQRKPLVSFPTVTFGLRTLNGRLPMLSFDNENGGTFNMQQLMEIFDKANEAMKKKQVEFPILEFDD